MKDSNSRIIESIPRLLKMFKKIDFSLKGTFEVVCRDKYGKFKWREVTENLIVNEGLNAILDIMLHASTQISTWRIAIFESNTTPGSTHTYAAPSYTESTAYDEAARPEFVEAAAASESITNSANKAVFTMNASKTIYGAALVGGPGSTAKGNTTGSSTGGTPTLFCSSKFASGKPVVDDDVLNITYTINASST